MRNHEKKNVECMGDLEKGYDRVNREALRQVLRMYYGEVNF